MKKILLFIVVVVLAVAYFTNPTTEKHQQTAKEMAERIVEKKLSSFNVPASWLKSENNSIVDDFTDKLIKQYVFVDNYYLFSLTKVEWEGEEYPVGVGLFGYVFIFEKVEEVINQKIDEYLQNQINNLLFPL